MNIRKFFKKIFVSLTLFVTGFVLSGCASANFNFKEDGSGNVTLTIAKSYEDPDTLETITVTRSDVEERAEQIVNAAEVDSGMEDRVRLKSIKEENDCYLVKFKFMRIQYLTPSAVGAGDIGLYSYKKSADFIQEIDSVSIVQDGWNYGSYKPLVKLVSNVNYQFDNFNFGNPDAAITPVRRETGVELTSDEVETFFSENSEMATDKKGKFFTFFICDMPGLDEVTFNFDGKINVYGSKNVKNVTDHSITVGSIKQRAKLIDSDANIENKDVDCFVGYVYFTSNPNFVLIGILGAVGVALIVLVIIGIKKGFFKKVVSSKKFKSIGKNKAIYLMLIPAMVMIFIFTYLPMGGVVLAFKNYKINDGIWNSEWASMGGLRNFYDLLTNPVSDFWKLLGNTFLLALWKFIFGFLLAILLAVLYSYLREGIFKKTVQSISYFPYFISWVVISTIAYVMLATDGGVINKIIVANGGEPINFYASPEYWPFILTATAMWKTMGYSTIVYLAAIVSIDPSLYEAAKLDGCGRFGQLIHVTIPGLAPVIGIQIVFSLGNLVRDDFDQIYTMIRGSSMLRSTTDTIGKIVYENISNASVYGGTAAMGLMQGLAGLALIILANNILKKRGIQGAY